jgi:hypothetical protein
MFDIVIVNDVLEVNFMSRVEFDVTCCLAA